VELRPERYSGRIERWNRILFEAVKQCGRAIVPKIELPARFDEIIARDGTRILFDAGSEPDPITRADEVTIFIGPEGGRSEGELHAARARGVLFQRLGPRRLRAETAAIAAVSVLAARFGDL
jgi:16S rRNA (uracil1498-N3)-methyltransferase